MLAVCIFYSRYALPANPQMEQTCIAIANEVLHPCNLVRIHFIIVMIRWIGLAPWELGFPFPGNSREFQRSRRTPRWSRRASPSPTRFFFISLTPRVE